MDVKIKAVGGYNEIGRNMTYLEVDGNAVILDMGIHVDKIVSFGEREELSKLPLEKLYEMEALPDDRILDGDLNKVKAILLSHGHLDHVGGVPFLASRYPCTIYGTPYTIEVTKFLVKDQGIKIPNKMKKINPNSSIEITDKMEAEFINMTHSIPQSTFIAIHTPKGYIVYASDYKFDNHPLLGSKYNLKRLKEIGKEGVLALLVESTRICEESKTNSELVARYMLEDVMTGEETDGVMIVTTFSSHIARLKSIVEISENMGRTPVFLGRSLNNYIKAAEKIGLVNFSKKYKIFSDAKKIAKTLEKVQEEGRENYVLIVTGHQGEPNSVLDRMARGILPWVFTNDDVIIFSSIVIPYPTNQANRQMLEARLKKNGVVRIIKDVHVSGHARREDHRRLLRILDPDIIIPMHGDIIKEACWVDLATEEGYELGKDIFIMRNGQEKQFKF